MFEGMVRLADDIAAIKVGRRCVMVEATALDQHDTSAARQQSAGRRLTGRARSDDGNVCGDRLRRINSAVDTH